MAVTLPRGSVVSIASTYGAPVTMSAITNATEAVATLAASHGVAVDSILEVTSGWTRLNGRIARAKAVATNDVTLANINTSSTARFPAGSGNGSVRVISAWQQISQVMSIEASGGDQQFTNFSFVEDDFERQIPNMKNAQMLTITMADDSALAHHALLVTADADKTPRTIRISLPSGGVLYYNGYIGFNPTPTFTPDDVMAVRATLSLSAAFTRY